MLKVGDNNREINPVCDTVTMPQIQAGQEIELTCNRAGRYLMIQLPATQSHLNFCEIKAYEGSCQGEIIKGQRTICIHITPIAKRTKRRTWPKYY